MDLASFITVLIVIVIIAIQYIFFIRALKISIILRNIFPENINLEESTYLSIVPKYIDKKTKQISNTDQENSSEHIKVNLIAISNPQIKPSNELQSIIKNTNRYLANNCTNSIDFNVIKNLTERVCDNIEQQIISIIPRPLYTGLLGTFSGVILGIFFLIRDGKFNQEAINSFLMGVLIAMVGSFFGLLLTSILSTKIFKDAKRKKDKALDDYLNFLQINLLPLTGNQLGREIIEFRDSLVEFNREFGNNLATSNNTIKLISENISKQIQLLEKIEGLNISKIVKFNTQTFERIEEISHNLEKYQIYTRELENSSKAASELVSKIVALLDRLSNFERNIGYIGEIVNKNETTYVQVIDYIKKHFDSLDNSYEKLLNYINSSEDDIREFLYNYKKRIIEISDQVLKTINDIFDINQNDNLFLKYVGELNENINKISTQLQALNNISNNTENLNSLSINVNELKENLINLLNNTSTISEKLNKIQNIEKNTLETSRNLAILKNIEQNSQKANTYRDEIKKLKSENTNKNHNNQSNNNTVKSNENTEQKDGFLSTIKNLFKTNKN